MKFKVRRNKTVEEWFVLLTFYLLLLQIPLSDALLPFMYIDEVFAMLGLVLVLCNAIIRGTISMKNDSAMILLLLIIFSFVGLLGDFIYRYQPTQAVLIDFYTNIKFFLAIVTGYLIFCNSRTNRCPAILTSHARAMATIFFLILLFDVIFHIFPSAGERYGLRSVQLFYSHTTYLAGAMVFLLTILLAFYEKKNLIFMFFALAVLAATLRGKAIGGVFACVAITYFFIYGKKKIRPVHIVIIAVVAIIVAWEQIQYYYIELAGESARSMLTTTSIQIMKDYFPIGTGFGTFASASAAEYYSPVYLEYGLNLVWGLSEDYLLFSSDSFWPIIIGQTGFIGTVCFVLVLLLLFIRLQKIRTIDVRAYAAGLFAFAYIMICSMAEPAFHNSVAIPLAMMIGYIFTLEKKHGKET